MKGKVLMGAEVARIQKGTMLTRTLKMIGTLIEDLVPDLAQGAERAFSVAVLIGRNRKD